MASRNKLTLPTVAPLVMRNGRPPLADDRSRLIDCPRHGPMEHRLFRVGRGRTRLVCKRCAGEAVTRRHRKVRLQLIEEAGGACALCGYDRCVVNLHFHHVDPSQKSFAMTLASGKALAAYQEEARKCILLCANCHGEVEAGLVESPPPQARWGDDRAA